MKPQNLKTKIFLDSGDPLEAKEIIDLLGFLDGQTTNPTLIAKSPLAQERLARGEKFSSQEAMSFYKEVIGQISEILPHGAISVEVYADQNTTAEEMIKQGQEMFAWIPNAYIKLPINQAGLQVAEELSKKGVRLNMTLCFSQEQASAVYSATKGAGVGTVFVSPFVGRLDDRGENGMDLIDNIVKMYKNGDGHVEVLSASVRNMDHFMASLACGADIITAPAKILKEWAQGGQQIPEVDYIYNSGDLKKIEYQEIDLNKNWTEYNISHELTDKGIERFASDWNGIIG